MYVEMEQHSGLISLNMSPFQLSPQGSPQSAGAGHQQSQPSSYGSQSYCNQSPALGPNHHAQQVSNQQQQQQSQQHQQQNMSSFEAAGFFDATSLEERCPMCGDKMSGYQYGLLTCESCKGFFKRNNSPCSYKKVYTCLFSPTGGSLSNLDQQVYQSQPQNQQNGAQNNAAAAASAPNPAAQAAAANNSNGINSVPQNVPVPGAICHPGLGQVGVVTGSIPGPSDFPDTKDLIEELCPVCGDKVSGYHYGLLTCESCKGFFKRTVQNKKVYTCVAERSCHIDKTQRKRCPFCRFQKCLEVGMKLEAVRADRMRGGRNKFGPMYKRDRARKLQLLRQRQLALQTIRGTLGDPSNYPSAVTPFLHIKQEIQIPQVSSLTSSPDSSPSPAAVAVGLVTTQANPQGAGQQHLIAPSSAAGTTITGSVTTASNHLHNNNPSNNPTLDQKLWAANSTTSSSPKGSTFAFGEQSGAHHAAHGTASAMPAPAAAAPSAVAALKTSPMIRDFLSTVDDREWQASLFGLLQNQTYNQCEVDLFELMCKVLDQNLFSQVDWARNSVFFKDLKVDDQMKLLQHSWSDMLVLDHLHQRLHNNLPDETTLHNGQKFDLLCLGLLGVPSLADLFNDLSTKLQDLKFDLPEYICMKFLMLLNHETRGLSNKKHVQEAHEQVQQALLDYTVAIYPSVPDKFNRLLGVLPEIHVVASRGEDHLYQKHCNGGAPTQTLLMEMLHAKRK